MQLFGKFPEVRMKSSIRWRMSSFSLYIISVSLRFLHGTSTRLGCGVGSAFFDLDDPFFFFVSFEYCRQHRRCELMKHQ